MLTVLQLLPGLRGVHRWRTASSSMRWAIESIQPKHSASASFEMRVVIGRVLERTALEPARGPEPIERRGITQTPKDGVRVSTR